MTRRNQYIAGVLVFAPLWFIASFVLMLMLVAAEDPGLPIGEIVTHVDGHEIVSMDPNYKGDHQGEFPPVPSWLKIANVVAMPLDSVLPEDGFKGLSDHANGLVGFLAMFVSSVLWGFLIVFTLRLVARRFGAAKIRVSLKQPDKPPQPCAQPGSAALLRRPIFPFVRSHERIRARSLASGLGGTPNMKNAVRAQ